VASGRPGARCLPVLVPLPEGVTVWAAAAGAHVCDALVAAQHLLLPALSSCRQLGRQALPLLTD
jgi:hypothetical protein